MTELPKAFTKGYDRFEVWERATEEERQEILDYWSRFPKPPDAPKKKQSAETVGELRLFLLSCHDDMPLISEGGTPGIQIKKVTIDEHKMIAPTGTNALRILRSAEVDCVENWLEELRAKKK
jgi:hypothetical protein